MDSAAASGHLDLVKWLQEHRPEGCTTKAMDSAAAYGHLETVKWLHANRLEGCTVKAMSNAAGSGHLEVLQWLFADRCEGFTDMAISKAALGGHLTVVQWLLSKKEPSAVYRRRTIEYAAASGSLHVLQYVCTKFPGDVNVSTIVRRGGKHLGTLQWLYERYPDQFDHAEVMNIVQEHHSKPHILAWLKSIHPRGWKRKSRK